LGNPSKTVAAHAEAGLIGAILVEPAWLAVAREQLSHRDFGSPHTRAVFKAFEMLADRGNFLTADQRVCEPNLIAETIRQNGDDKHFSKDPTLYFSAAASWEILKPDNAPIFIEQIQGAAILREFIEVASGCVADVQVAKPDEAARIITEVQVKFDGLFARRAPKSLQRIGDNLNELIHRITSGEGGLTGITTGFPKLDGLTSGIQLGEFTILGARPSHGKTSLAMDIAIGAAQFGYHVLFFSYEMAKAALIERALYSLAQVEPLRSRGANATFSEDDTARIQHAGIALGSLPLYISDAHEAVPLIRAKTIRHLREHRNQALVVVDYIQIVPTVSKERTKRENREQEVAGISQGLKRIATDLDVGVLVLAQIGRDVDRRADHTPVMADLRESGSIEQDADCIMLMHRPYVYNNTEKDEGVICVAKQRNGRTGTIRLPFFKEWSSFRNTGV